MSKPFGKEHAAKYDAKWEKLAPMRDALHFLSRIVMLDLAEDAQMLCVGAGTGTELLALAQSFPNWTFTVVEPSGAMLDICRDNAENAGISSRCQFHEGYLDTLSESSRFDAATSILVSQFLLDEEQRRAFFREIRHRLKPGAYLINADLAAPADAKIYASLEKAWIKAMQFNGLSYSAARSSTSGWGKGVAVLSPKEIEAIIASSGFDAVTLFYQSLFIHAWYAKNA